MPMVPFISMRLPETGIISTWKTDNIVFIDKGRIVEQGTHEELIKQKGYYYTLVNNQLELNEKAV